MATAKQTNSNSDTLVVDGRTGEIVHSSGPAPLLAAYNVNDPKFSKLVHGVVESKEKDFEAEVETFWKPQDPSRNQPKVLTGIYLGWEGGGAQGKKRQYLVAVPHPTRKGQALVMRLNSTEVLRKKFDACPVADENGQPESPIGVRVEFLRETKTSEGQRLLEWAVQWHKGGDTGKA